VNNAKSRIGEPPKNIRGTIGGSVVKDDVFEILKSLVKNAVDTLFYICFTVVDRCDYCNSGHKIPKIKLLGYGDLLLDFPLVRYLVRVGGLRFDILGVVRMIGTVGYHRYLAPNLLKSIPQHRRNMNQLVMPGASEFVFCGFPVGAGRRPTVVNDQSDFPKRNCQVLGLLFVSLPCFDHSGVNFAEINLAESVK
tara:strand:+ start:290 stop:871 length:582 start_codon:yes stop_codon:yes gene_type:complete